MPSSSHEILQGPVIAAGQFQSNALHLEDGFVVGLIAPENWNPAVVTVMVSVDGDNFFDLFTPTGQELVFNVVSGTIIAVDQDMMMMASYIKLRTGTRDAPVMQDQGCRFYTVIRHALATTMEE